MSNKKRGTQAESSETESRRILDRIDQESETIGTSSLARTAEKTRDHFMGNEQGEDDPIEIWGKRIGRILSLIAVVVLIIYLYNTYLA